MNLVYGKGGIKVIIKFKNINFSLGTRKLGESIRNTISQNIIAEEIIVFDFADVDLISNSFADECFGKLIEDFGIDYVKSKTTFRNVNPLIDMVIKKAITDRIKKNLLCQV